MTHSHEVIDAAADTRGIAFTIELGAEAAAEIRQSTMAAFRSLPYGGLEIGGVLLGRVLPNVASPTTVEIVGSRPIECDHAAGPAFVLSNAERLQIPQLFENIQQELSVVGFWVSHGRSDLALTAHDAELYQALFPYPWQVALILKPESNRPLREAFFWRIDGRVSPHTQPEAEQEPAVETDPLPAGPRLRSYWEPPPAEPVPEAIPEVFVEPVAVKQSEPVEPVPVRSLRVHKQSFGVWSGLTFMVFGLLLGGALSYLLFGNQSRVTAKAPAPQLNLEMFNAGKDTLIHWDATSPIVGNARAAELRIRDGRMVQTLVLDLAALSRGHCHYQPTGSEVQTTLIVTGKDGRVARSTASQQIAF